MKTLALIITTDRCPDQVWSLAQTANAKKLQVRIHLAGPGVRLIREPGFRQLARRAAITICTESASSFLTDKDHRIEYSQWLAPPDQMARLIAQCDRHLVL